MRTVNREQYTTFINTLSNVDWVPVNFAQTSVMRITNKNGKVLAQATYNGSVPNTPIIPRYEIATW
jgi:hypothetical protein